MARKSGVKQEIFNVWDKHPDLAAKEIHKTVIEKLGDKKSRKGTYPGLRLVQKYVKEFRDKLGQSVGTDKPWSLVTLTEYPITPESIPMVLEIQELRRKNNSRPLTIKLALWVSRLTSIIKNTKVLPLAEVIDDWAIHYSAHERMRTITNDFDTTKFDRIVYKYPEEYVLYPNLWKFMQDEEGFDNTGFTLSFALELRRASKERELNEKEKQIIERIAFLEKQTEQIKHSQMADLYADVMKIGEVNLRKKHKKVLKQNSTEGQNEGTHN